MADHSNPPKRDLDAVIFAVGLIALVLLGAALRLEEPLSSPAMGAEDPYTHVVFTKEHVRRGYFDDARTLGTSLYPPGLHAFTAIVAPLGGVDLYQFARFSPVAFGALSVLGVGVLANRLGGTAAGLGAALLAAATPEMIVRTNLFFPTMLDIVLIPPFFFLFALTLDRKWGAVPLVVLIGIVLCYSHPWVVPIACVAAGIAAALGALSETPRGAAMRVGIAALIAAPLMALSASARWDQGNTGFADFVADGGGPLASLSSLAYGNVGLFVTFTVILLLAAALPLGLIAGLAALRPHLPKIVRIAIGLAVGAVLGVIMWAFGRSPPPLVHYWGALGAVVIALAFAGLVLALARPTPLSHWAVSMAVVTFPLTAIPIFSGVHDAKHWPARAVVYLAVACALLGAVAITFAAHEAKRLIDIGRAKRFTAPTAALAAVLLVGGALAVAPEDADVWYRLYSDDHFEHFQKLAERSENEYHSRVVVASWQPGLMLKALMDPNHVRYSPKFYNMSDKRDSVIAEAPGWTTYVVVDSFLLDRMQQPGSDIDLTFLDHGYTLIDSSTDNRWRAYLREGT